MYVSLTSQLSDGHGLYHAVQEEARWEDSIQDKHFSPWIASLFEVFLELNTMLIIDQH